MGIVVQKFGGSSVADIDKIRHVATRVTQEVDAGNKVVVVVSAMGDTTDELLELAAQTGASTRASREMDMLLATGEQQTAALLALVLDQMGYPAISLTGWQAGILTDQKYSKARINDVNSERLDHELDNGKIVVVAGFQGLTEDGDVTTLGRGGSDTTAVALAAAIKADVCDIYTDVEGVFTADPRLVPNARKMKTISYEEMLELASLGAVVMQPRAVEYGMLYGVPIQVRSTFKETAGSIIMGVKEMENRRPVTGVAHDFNVGKLALFDVPDVPGVASRIFNALADESIDVDMIIQSAMQNDHNDIAFTVSAVDLPRAHEVINRVAEDLGGVHTYAAQNVAKVSIVGAGMQSNPGVAAAMFAALSAEGINIQMISTSEIKVSCIIDSIDCQRAVKALHQRFELDKE
ncbi:MAG: aspartate kinase [Methylocystaceae bacterium]